MAIKLGQGKVISKGGQSTQGLEIALSKLNDGDSIRVRLVGEVEPNYRYWVPCTNGKSKPIITPFFDKENEVLSSKDPLLGEGRKEFFYTMNAIVRSGSDTVPDEMKVLILKTTIYRSLVSLAMDEEYGDPTDVVTGYDIIITKERTGPKPMNVKYEVRAGRVATPLDDFEKGLEQHKLSELYKAPEESDYIEWISMNTDLLNVAASPTDVNVPSNSSADDDIPF